MPSPCCPWFAHHSTSFLTSLGSTYPARPDTSLPDTARPLATEGDTDAFAIVDQ